MRRKPGFVFWAVRARRGGQDGVPLGFTAVEGFRREARKLNAGSSLETGSSKQRTEFLITIWKALGIHGRHGKQGSFKS